MTFLQFYSNQYEQDQKPLSALSLDCLCQGGPTPCSCSNHSNTRPGISLCSRPRLSLQSKGLFLVRWQCGDTGLLDPILVMWNLNPLWKLHGLLGPYFNAVFKIVNFSRPHTTTQSETILCPKQGCHLLSQALLQNPCLGQLVLAGGQNYGRNCSTKYVLSQLQNNMYYLTILY